MTLQGVLGRWGEFIDLSRSVHPPLPALVQPGDKLKVLRDGTLQHVVSRQKLPRTDAPRAALPPARTNDDVIEVPPHAATTAGGRLLADQDALLQRGHGCFWLFAFACFNVAAWLLLPSRSFLFYS